MNFTNCVFHLDISPIFMDNIRLLVENILEPSRLPAKKIGGKYVTGDELNDYLNIFVERLQSPSFSPKSLFQVRSVTVLYVNVTDHGLHIGTV
jgi:hypothetical protein